MIDDIDRDVFVRTQTDLLVVGDSIMTDRNHASNGNYEDDDPQNQIGGIIPAFPLFGWLRHGMEEIVQEYGGTACHLGEGTQTSARTASTTAISRPDTMRRARVLTT
ncbi:hypothetical protein C482_15016 [Natrialba chahannaoensis JCM 10990]|uniref:Uncharacterized protein n=1 Tax=Natrialba chahannaoensis JCM 10990 TaxID=1227492 RepID=M0AE61_9EURY|nr:hypothetical protein C482_15016 [Natrialba chahannaoensis JCM 10990]